jgi:hypothetical protein
MLCTGATNILIVDHSGDFFGSVIKGAADKPSAATSNLEVGEGLKECKFNKDWNSYWCKSEQLAVFEFESRAADK